jgi:hypothetical protein
MMAAAISLLDEAGQQLFDPPNVKGWPGGKHWITSTSIFVRYSVVAAMANGTLGGNFGHGRFLNPIYLKDYKPKEAPANEDPKKAARRADREAVSRAYHDRIKAWALSVPPAPPANEMVNVKSLFPGLEAEPTPEKVVDAAIARFLQRPMNDAGRATLIQSLGKKPLKIGDEESDARVRKMIGLLLSTPEYQVH